MSRQRISSSLLNNSDIITLANRILRKIHDAEIIRLKKVHEHEHDSITKEFETIKTEFIKKDKINKIHNDNVALLNKLNSTYTSPGRKVSPILMLPDANAGIVDMMTIRNEIDKVLKSKEGDIITKSDIFVALKIGMNFSANVAILAILKSIEKNISQYENLSQALFAFAAEIESEVMKEQEFIGGISDDLNTIEEETKGSMPKIVDIEPVFETNVNDFQEKNDDDAIDAEEDKNNE